MKYQQFTDDDDGQGCRGAVWRSGEPKYLHYDEGEIMDVGRKFNNTCMIKYEFTNKNSVHDLRLQIWNLEVSAVYLSIKLVSASTLAILMYSSF